MKTSKKNRNNGSVIFNILAVSGKGRSQMKTLFLAAIAALMIFAAVACDRSHDGVENTMTSALLVCEEDPNVDVDEASADGDTDSDSDTDTEETPVTCETAFSRCDEMEAFSAQFELGEASDSTDRVVTISSTKPEMVNGQCKSVFTVTTEGVTGMSYDEAQDHNGLLQAIMFAGYSVDSMPDFIQFFNQENADVQRVLLKKDMEPEDTRVVVCASAHSSANAQDYFDADTCVWKRTGVAGEEEPVEVEVIQNDWTDLSYCAEQYTVAFKVEPGTYDFSFECGSHKGKKTQEIFDTEAPNGLKVKESDGGVADNALCTISPTLGWGPYDLVVDVSVLIGRGENSNCVPSQISDEARAAATMTFDTGCLDFLVTGEDYVEPDAGPGINLVPYNFLNLVSAYTGSVDEITTGCTVTVEIDGGSVTFDGIFFSGNVT